MRSIVAAGVVVAVTALAEPALSEPTLKVYCAPLDPEYKACKNGVEAWNYANKGKASARVEPAPRSSTERLKFYQKLFREHGDIDVLQIDVVWLGTLASDLLDLSKIPDRDGRRERLQTCGDRRLLAIPWSDTRGLLYYRKKLLDKYGRDPPKTWEEMEQTARFIMTEERRAGNDQLWGYVFQGHAYEGLTVNALEWLDSDGAGTIIDSDHRITVNNPKAAKALALAASWINSASPIAPPSVLHFTEEETHQWFKDGKAVFMRNWPYALELVNTNDSAVKDDVSVTDLPAGPGGKPASVIGGEQLAVSSHSSNPEAAVDLALAVAGTLHAIENQATHDHSVTEFCKTGEGARTSPFTSRPTAAAGAQYEQVSAAFWTTVHIILSGEGDAGSELGRLERKLYRIMHADSRVGSEP